MSTNLVDLLKLHIKESVRALYSLELLDVGIEHPQNPAWGDYSSNVALVNAKKLGKSPSAVADEIVEFLRKTPINENFKNINVAGSGFINFTLDKKFHLLTMLDILSMGDAYGSNNLGNGTRVALEHSNVNPNKAAHIGHLRNAVLGQFIERVYEFLGYDVKVQYYANDLGVQVSTSLLGLRELGDRYDLSKYPKYDHYMWDIYADISSKIATDPTLKKKLDEIVVSLDSREPYTAQAQMELSRRVLKDNLTTFANLGVTYDLIVYESSIKDMQMWEKTFSILKGNKNVYLSTQGNSKGCWLVKMGYKEDKECAEKRLSKERNDVEEDKIIVRSNGVPTYTGKDIAYHLWKFGLLGIDFKYKMSHLIKQKTPIYETSTTGKTSSNFSPSDIVINVIDVKQTYAIDAVRKSLNYLGYKKQSDNLIHVNYGHVYLSPNTAKLLGYDLDNQKEFVPMSGRKGLGVKIDDFTQMVSNRLVREHGDFPNLVEVRNSAIKFDILRYDTFQDVVFDVDSALQFKGFTGPYIQYTHARASSVLSKADYTSNYAQNEKNPNALLERFLDIDLAPSESEVLKLLYRFPEVVFESSKKYAPNLICNYLYELCQRFNTFYNDSPILSAPAPELKDFRLALTAATKQVIKTGLYLLGITAVDRM